MKELVWGAATSAYQIEGAVRADGRGESIWDRFCATPGKVRAGDTGETACDFYRRYPEDVALMRELGLDAFRFSIAWPRVVPEGRGRVNDAGLDFYDRLVDTLLQAGIEPLPTLYHWDLPQPLEDAGGWPARATVEAFADYVAVVAGRLGDRVGRWLTINEPWVASQLGYGWGMHAPGRTSPDDALAAAHHLLLAHGRAVEVLRATAPQAEVGIALDLVYVQPATRSEEDVAAAEREDARRNRWYLDAVFRGTYPEESLPPLEDGDLETISAPTDFLGLNYYARQLHGAGGLVLDPASPFTASGWEVYPDGLYELLVRVHDEYAPEAIVVTENGAWFADVRGHDGSVRDPERQAYLEAHTAAALRAREAGVPVAGYFVWSLLDNFEWALGYQPRFGLVYVDYPTLERVPKQSFEWYRGLVAARHATRTEGHAVAS
jgi:beta-glucosidase